MKEEFSKLGDLLGPALRRYHFDQTITQSQVAEAYKAIAGPMLTKLTYSIHFDTAQHVLHLRLASPALRQELSYRLTDLANSINERLGNPLVKKIMLG